MCCSFYLQNNCTNECPSGLVNDSNFLCGEFSIILKLFIATNLSYAHT